MSGRSAEIRDQAARPRRWRFETEIGWHIRKTAWNQGIATEAAMAVRDVAFARFALSRLVAIIHPEHVASRHVAENIEMRDEKTTVIEDYPAVIYAIGRANQGRCSAVVFESAR